MDTSELTLDNDACEASVSLEDDSYSHTKSKEYVSKINLRDDDPVHDMSEEEDRLKLYDDTNSTNFTKFVSKEIFFSLRSTRRSRALEMYVRMNNQDEDYLPVEFALNRAICFGLKENRIPYVQAIRYCLDTKYRFTDEELKSTEDLYG